MFENIYVKIDGEIKPIKELIEDYCGGDEYYTDVNGCVVAIINLLEQNKIDKVKLDILNKIRIAMLNTNTKCRFCGEGEDNNHDEGIHIINSFINGDYKL